MRIGIISKEAHAKSHVAALEREGFEAVLLGSRVSLADIPPSIEILVCRNASVSHSSSWAAADWEKTHPGRVVFENGVTQIVAAVKRLTSEGQMTVLSELENFVKVAGMFSPRFLRHTPARLAPLLGINYNQELERCHAALKARNYPSLRRVLQQLGRESLVKTNKPGTLRPVPGLMLELRDFWVQHAGAVAYEPLFVRSDIDPNSSKFKALRDELGYWPTKEAAEKAPDSRRRGANGASDAAQGASASALAATPATASGVAVPSIRIAPKLFILVCGGRQAGDKAREIRVSARNQNDVRITYSNSPADRDTQQRKAALSWLAMVRGSTNVELGLIILPTVVDSTVKFSGLLLTLPNGDAFDPDVILKPYKFVGHVTPETRLIPEIQEQLILDFVAGKDVRSDLLHLRKQFEETQRPAPVPPPPPRRVEQAVAPKPVKIVPSLPASPLDAAAQDATQVVPAPTVPAQAPASTPTVAPAPVVEPAAEPMKNLPMGAFGTPTRPTDVGQFREAIGLLLEEMRRTGIKTVTLDDKGQVKLTREIILVRDETMTV